MSERIHDDEFDTGEHVVRALLAEQLPHYADATLAPVRGTGTSNSLWRLRDGSDSPIAVVRLPRTAGAVGSLTTELELLPALAESDLDSIVTIPRLLHAGTPTTAFGHPWAVTDWLDGDDAWTARDRVDGAGATLAAELAAVVEAVGALEGLPAPDRAAGRRGGPLGPLLDGLERWLADPRWDAAARLDVAAVRRIADEARELVDEAVAPSFLHGDLIPGNLLIDAAGHLRAVIDWGGAGYGDPADDLVAAWAVFDDRARAAFRASLPVDDAAWIRARTFAVEQAVGGVLYYEPRGNPLGDVMRRTLQRILAECDA